MKTTVLSEEAISMYDLKAELENIQTRDGELGFRAAKTQDYLNNFAKLDVAKAIELKKKLEELAIPRFKSEHACKLIDVLPTDAEDVKLTLNSYSVTLTNENAAKIADVIKGFKK